MGENSELGLNVRSSETRVILSVYVEDIKMTGKKPIVAPMWNKLMKHVDIDEPASFLDHAHLGCTQRECRPNETIIEQFQVCLLEQRTNYQDGKTQSTNSSVVLRHGTTCSKVR